MSSDWAWKQAVCDTSIIHLSIWGPSLMHFFQDIISKDPETHGSMFVPVIIGSDKTTISVTTGHSEYWPLYASIGIMFGMHMVQGLSLWPFWPS